MRIGTEAKKAMKIGALCAIAYLTVYIIRNVLGAVTPQLVEAGYSEAYIGSVSSLYFLA